MLHLYDPSNHTAGFERVSTAVPLCPSNASAGSVSHTPKEDSDQLRQRVLLIDLDNCPRELLSLGETAASYDLIVASHGCQEPRVPLGLVEVLGPLVADRKIEICAMPAGKNSADFGLTFVAGRLSVEMPPGTIFEIASKDKDLDHAVRLLRQAGLSARRVDASSRQKTSPPAARPPVSLLAAKLARSLCGRGAKSRPKRRESLHAAVKARSPTPEAGMSALAELERTKAITYNAQGNPQYSDDRLEAFAALAPKTSVKTEPLPLPKLRPPAWPTRRKSERDALQMELFDLEDASVEKSDAGVPF